MQVSPWCLSHLIDHEGGCQQEDGAVTRVPEHDGEQEGEGGDGEDGGVHLPVAVHAVGVHQALHSTAGGVI